MEEKGKKENKKEKREEHRDYKPDTPQTKKIDWATQVYLPTLCSECSIMYGVAGSGCVGGGKNKMI